MCALSASSFDACRDSTFLFYAHSSLPPPPSHFFLLHSPLGWSAQFRPDACYGQWKSEHPKDTTTSCGPSDKFLNLSETWGFFINKRCLILQVKESSRHRISVTCLSPLLLLLFSMFEESFPTEETLLKALHRSSLYQTRRWEVPGGLCFLPEQRSSMASPLPQSRLLPRPHGRLAGVLAFLEESWPWAPDRILGFALPEQPSENWRVLFQMLKNLQ